LYACVVYRASGGSGWGVAGRGVRAVFLEEVVDLGRRLVNFGEAGRLASSSSVRPPSCDAAPMRMWPAVLTFRPITGMFSWWQDVSVVVPSGWLSRRQLHFS